MEKMEKMENYERCIIDTYQGETPKQKYEWLLSQLSKVHQAQVFIRGLKEAPDGIEFKYLRSFIDANFEMINE